MLSPVLVTGLSRFPELTAMTFYIESTVGDRIRKFLRFVLLLLLIAVLFYMMKAR